VLQVVLSADRAQRSADLSKLEIEIWKRRESSYFSFTQMLASPQKSLSFFSFDTFDARNIKPAAAVRYVLTSSFSSKRHVMYSVQLSAECGLDRTGH
jgi:hypothetical protein